MWRGVTWAWLGWVVLVLAGCGGSGEKSNEAPFHQQLEQAKREPNAESRARRLIALARRQVAARDLAGARDALLPAAAAAAEVSDPISRANLLVQLARAQLEAGQDSEARKTLSAAKETAAAIDEAMFRASALADIGQAYAAQNRPGSAAAALEEAQQTLEEVPGDDDSLLRHQRFQTLANIARGYHAAGEPATAETIVQQALKEADELADARQAARGRAVVARALVQMKQADQAQQVFERALEKARQIEDSLQRAYALLEIAVELRGAGRAGEARTALAEAESAGDQVPQKDLRDEIYRRIRDEQAASRR